ncbi:hypothetical protein SUGI_0567740 [Cryptomeria japonica]|nr:hypothetical protein SUGI_0567740 [Cryptomeria japonica]
MADPGFISGMIGFAIQLAASRVTRDINVAIRCRKELDTLKVLLLKIQSMNMEMQQYRKALNSGRLTTSPHHTLPSTVNSWLEELNALLEEASDLAQHCTVPSYSHLFSRYRTSKKIRRLFAFLHQMQQQVTNQQVLEQIKEKVDSLNLRTSAFACTSGDPIPSTSSASPNKKYVEEALIVGQDSASNRLVELIHSQQHKNVSRFGLAGKGGADDVWETSATSLLEELCDPHSPLHNSNIIIATSRSNSVLSQLGVPRPSIIQMQDLSEDDSWRLFSSHAFLHSEGVLPMSIDQDIARRVCNECGGLPLALKVVGQAMAGITQSNEWELAVKRLQNDVTNSLYGKLRLSYVALADLAGYGISLQLCFLCLAAYPEDSIISSTYATAYWIGEGLVAGPDPFKIGEMYINLLADRCLIEPVKKNYEGRVLCFRVHDVLRDLAQQFAAKEEKCFFQAGRGLRQFPVDVSSGYIRISLIDNSLTSVPRTFRPSHIRSLLLAGNTSLAEISKEVIGNMTSLRVLDLSRTALLSLPKNIGILKHLVCLKLPYVPIKRLPNSVAALRSLQILDLQGSDIAQLPAGISKLTSLKLLDVAFCEHLQCMPYGIADLTSLEYLNASNSPNIGWNKCRRNRLSISHLGNLNQLRRLGFQNNGEIIGEGILGTMKQMEYLYFHLTDMESLPHDMTAMAKLRELCLICPHLLKIENSICEFRHLSFIKLIQCDMLKQLPALHKLPSLKHLDIVNCPNIEKFPEEFGKGGAFPKLEVFSVVDMMKLEQLPVVEGGALPSLKTLTIMKCEALQRLPECYWNLKSVEKIRVYGCSKVQHVMAEEENFIKTKTKVQTIRVSTTEIQALEERYFDMRHRGEHFYYGEFWCNEVFRFLEFAMSFIIQRNGI